MELVFECAGSTFTANQAVQIVARGGKIMMVGTQSKPVPIDFLKINREVTIQTSFRYCNNYPQTIEAIRSGKFNVKDMVDAVIFKNYDVGNVFLRYFYDMEIDFIISNGNKLNPKIYPIEVKSSKKYTIKSLDKFIETYHKRIGQAYIIHTKNLMRKDNVICLPSYMTFCL